MKNLIIFLLLAVTLWFGAAIVRLENARYAASLGMCDRYSGLSLPERAKCMDNTNTRTSWVYNLLYGLGVL